MHNAISRLGTVRERHERLLCLVALLWATSAGAASVAWRSEPGALFADRAREQLTWTGELHERREHFEHSCVWAVLDGVPCPL